jgi:hypothetical protein
MNSASMHKMLSVIFLLSQVTLYDPNTMKAEHVFDAHSGTLSDFDIHGNLLVTCGFSSRYVVKYYFYFNFHLLN